MSKRTPSPNGYMSSFNCKCTCQQLPWLLQLPVQKPVNSKYAKTAGYTKYRGRIITRHTKCFSTTSPLKNVHWLPVLYPSILKRATIVYKFLHTGNPSYLSKSISICTCPYETRRGKSDNMFLNVPLFSSYVYTLKQFGHSLSFDRNIRLVTSISNFWKQLKAYLFAKAFPP